MRKRMMWGFLILFLLFCGPARGEGTTRCLLVGVDHFVSQPETSPAAENNLRRMERMLTSHLDGEVTVRAALDGVGSVAEFSELFSGVFADADAGDVSLIYFSTHGVKSEDGTALLLSDGEREEGLSPKALREMLLALPGKKVVLLDACYSGAFIGKGIPRKTAVLEEEFLFGENLRVLVSAGGEEDSYFWQDSSGLGGSYFLAALESVLIDSGSRSGKNTEESGASGSEFLCLQEVTEGIRALCGVSRAYCWPEDDREPLFRVGAGLADSGSDWGNLRGLRFLETEPDPFRPRADMVFEVSEPVYLWYQMAPWKDGKWDFDAAVKLPDRERYGGSRGQTGPGEKTRTVRLSSVDGEESGTALLQVLSVFDGTTRPEGSRRIALTGEGEVSLSVELLGILGSGAEMGWLVSASLPCMATVFVVNEAGEVARTLVSGEACIPGAGLYVYWSGRGEDGAFCSPGMYRIRAVCSDAWGVREAFSSGFELGEKENGPRK